MNGRREIGLYFSIREVFNVGFLSSGVTVRRDVLMMCVSAGKSVGEIAWRRCVGIGSRGHVVGWLERRNLDTSALVKDRRRRWEFEQWMWLVVGPVFVEVRTDY